MAQKETRIIIFLRYLDDFKTFFSSGGASAVKEPGHFEVRKSSSQVWSPGVPDAAKGSPLSSMI